MTSIKVKIHNAKPAFAIIARVIFKDNMVKAAPRLLGCEDNAHNEIWGSSDTSRSDGYLYP